MKTHYYNPSSSSATLCGFTMLGYGPKGKEYTITRLAELLTCQKCLKILLIHIQNKLDGKIKKIQ